MRTRVLTCIIACLLIGAVTIRSYASSMQVTMTISFPREQSDTEVKSFLKKYNARPYAVFLAFGDMHGSHRVEKSKAGSSVIDEARHETIRIEGRALEGAATRAKNILVDQSLQSFSKNQPLVQEGQSLLKRADVIRALKSNAEGGGALIYGLQVLVNQADAQRISLDRSIESQKERLELTIRGPRMIAPSPELYTSFSKGREAAQNPLTAAQTYAALNDLIINDKKEANDGN